jgi:hypothetical protein
VLAFIAPPISGALNLVWFAVIIGLVICGVRWSKPGLALAPVLFLVVWACAAVVSQWRLQESIDPKVWDRPTSPEASAQRTLIVQAFSSIDRKIVADGHVDRLIKLQLDDSNQRISGIEEISLARGERARPKTEGLRRNCRRPDVPTPASSGAALPRFLTVSWSSSSSGSASLTAAQAVATRRKPGCGAAAKSGYCSRGTRAGLCPVLFPGLRLLVPSTRLWEAGSGLSHPVRYGLDDIDPITMISAIYGVTSAYNRILARLCHARCRA